MSPGLGLGLEVSSLDIGKLERKGFVGSHAACVCWNVPSATQT